MSSRINSPLSRPPLELEPRAVSASAKARIIARDKVCTYPECEVSTGLEVDHIVPLAMGGRNDDRNLAALCHDHHLQKTRLDVKLIAKAKRRNLKHTGQFPKAKQQIKGRGFPRRWEDQA